VQITDLHVHLQFVLKPKNSTGTVGLASNHLFTQVSRSQTTVFSMLHLTCGTTLPPIFF